MSITNIVVWSIFLIEYLRRTKGRIERKKPGIVGILDKIEFAKQKKNKEEEMHETFIVCNTLNDDG